LANFEYLGKNTSGETVTGTIEAVNASAVADRLLARGVSPVSITEATNSESILDLDIGKILQSKTVKTQDLVMFSRQMYSLTKAGIPLSRAIAGLLESTNSPVLREALESINTDLNAGVNLATSFSRHPHIFTPIYISLIHVGENSGRLEEAFRQIASYLELEQRTKQQIKSATRYPMFVILAILGAVVVINLFVMPQFVKMFEAFGAAQLPLPTRILIATSNYFVDYWHVTFLAMFAAIFAFYRYISSEKGKFWWDEKKLKIPIFGDIIYRSLLARFSRTFSMMIRSGVPLINALNIVADVVSNDWVAKHIHAMRDGVERGESIRLVANRTGLFSPLVLQMISVGEETGQLDEMLEQVANFYEEQVDYDLKKLADYIEPVLIVFIGIIVLILMLAVYLPMWELTSVNR
jgi:MSHA biogenesis protein MshG